MPDTISKKERSKIMARVKAKNTQPEMWVRSYLFSEGYRYRLYSKQLPGSPDIVLSKLKTVIFIHGCFWHGHKNCDAARLPKSNIGYWEQKLYNNQKRDVSAVKQLRKLGWNVIIVWECKLKSLSKRIACFRNLKARLQKF